MRWALDTGRRFRVYRASVPEAVLGREAGQVLRAGWLCWGGSLLMGPAVEIETKDL